MTPKQGSVPFLGGARHDATLRCRRRAVRPRPPAAATASEPSRSGRRRSAPPSRREDCALALLLNQLQNGEVRSVSIERRPLRFGIFCHRLSVSRRVMDGRTARTLTEWPPSFGRVSRPHHSYHHRTSASIATVRGQRPSAEGGRPAAAAWPAVPHRSGLTASAASSAGSCFACRSPSANSHAPRRTSRFPFNPSGAALAMHASGPCRAFNRSPRAHCLFCRRQLSL